MDSQEYKIKKFDKLTRDVVQMVNQTPTLGYGDDVDALAKSTLTNHLLNIIRISDMKDLDIEILAQSLNDDLLELTINLVGKIKRYQLDIQE